MKNVFPKTLDTTLILILLGFVICCVPPQDRRTRPPGGGTTYSGPHGSCPPGQPGCSPQPGMPGHYTFTVSDTFSFHSMEMEVHIESNGMRNVLGAEDCIYLNQQHFSNLNIYIIKRVLGRETRINVCRSGSSNGFSNTQYNQHNRNNQYNQNNHNRNNQHNSHHQTSHHPSQGNQNTQSCPNQAGNLVLANRGLSGQNYDIDLQAVSHPNPNCSEVLGEYEY